MHKSSRVATAGKVLLFLAIAGLGVAWLQPAILTPGVPFHPSQLEQEENHNFESLSIPAVAEPLMKDARTLQALSISVPQSARISSTTAYFDPKNMQEGDAALIGLPETIKAFNELNYSEQQGAQVTGEAIFTQLAVVANAKTAAALQSAGIASRVGDEWVFDAASYLKTAQSQQVWAELPDSPFVDRTQRESDRVVLSGGHCTSDSYAQFAGLLAGIDTHNSVSNSTAELESLAQRIAPAMPHSITPRSTSDSEKAAFENFASQDPNSPAMTLIYENQYLAAKVNPRQLTLPEAIKNFRTADAATTSKAKKAPTEKSSPSK